MTEQPQAWQIEFYTDARGKSPVLDFISSLPSKERAKIAYSLRLLQEFGTALGMPHARPLKGHKPLWELRPFPNRLIYFAHRGCRVIVLHAFRKTDLGAQRREIAVAERRIGEVLQDENAKE